MKDNLKDTVIMTGEPIPNKTPADVRDYFSKKTAEKDLADALAIINNKFWWTEDNIYDYKKGTPEYIEACAITDEWRELMYEYEERIYVILRNEGITVPESRGRIALERFMKRNGYKDGAGWWIKDE